MPRSTDRSAATAIGSAAMRAVAAGVRAMKAWLVLVLAACGGDGSTKVDAAVIVDSDPNAPDAMPREVIMETHSLDPGELVEGIMTGGPSDSAHIELMGPTPTIGWN